MSVTGCVGVGVCEYERFNKPTVFNSRNTWLTPFPDTYAVDFTLMNEKP
jgi:hypothetical protein